MNSSFHVHHIRQERITTYMVGPDRVLSMPGLFYLYQEAAQSHASILGWGYHEMKEMNRIWALLRVHVLIMKMPEWEQDVILETWPKDMNGLFASRDFIIYDQDHQPMIKGTSLWTVLDRQTRKPVKSNLFEGYPVSGWEHAIQSKPKKIDWPDHLMVAEQQRVGYSHMDMNGHVNNTRYLEWAINQFDDEYLFRGKPSEIEINFVNEIMKGQEIEVLRPVFENDSKVQSAFIRTKDTQQPVYAIRVKYQ